jgi:hypothetical protein
MGLSPLSQCPALMFDVDAARIFSHGEIAAHSGTIAGILPLMSSLKQEKETRD